MVGDRGGDEADAFALPQSFLRPGEQHIQRLLARGAVDVSRQAETAAAATTTSDLHQVHAAEFGVGRVEAADGAITLQIPHPQTLDTAGFSALLGHRWNQGGDIETGDTIEGGKQFRARGVDGLLEKIDQIIHHLFALTHDDGIEEGSHRFGVHGDARPAGDEQGPRFVSVLGQRRHSGLSQHLHHVEIVHFVGDGESPHREISDMSPRLQAEQGPSCLLPTFVPENTFAHDALMLIEAAIQDLQRQRAHAHVVAVGEGQGHRQPPAPVFEDRAGFVGEQLLVLGMDGPGHVSSIAGRMDIGYLVLGIKQFSCFPPIYEYLISNTPTLQPLNQRLACQLMPLLVPVAVDGKEERASIRRSEDRQEVEIGNVQFVQDLG